MVRKCCMSYNGSANSKTQKTEEMLTGITHHLLRYASELCWDRILPETTIIEPLKHLKLLADSWYAPPWLSNETRLDICEPLATNKSEATDPNLINYWNMVVGEILGGVLGPISPNVHTAKVRATVKGDFRG